jgi:hypothetical protein
MPVHILDSDNSWKEVTRSNFFIRDVSSTKNPEQIWTLDSDNEWKPWFLDEGVVSRGCSTPTRSSSTSVVVNFPANVQDGDLLVALLTEHVSSVNLDSTISTPSGWTRFFDPKYSGLKVGEAPAVNCFYKVYDESSDGSSETFAFSGSEVVMGTICAYAGYEASDPIEVDGVSINLDRNENWDHGTNGQEPNEIRRVYRSPAHRSACPGMVVQLVATGNVDGDITSTFDDERTGELAVEYLTPPSGEPGTMLVRHIPTNEGGEATTNLISAPDNLHDSAWTKVQMDEYSGPQTGTYRVRTNYLVEEPGTTGRHGFKQDFSVYEWRNLLHPHDSLAPPRSSPE